MTLTRGWRARLRSPSIALRMSLIYAVSAFAVVLAATGFLYWVLSSNLDREDARFQADELENIRLMVGKAPLAVAAVPLPAAADRELYVRLIGPAGDVRLESPGMRQVLPPPTRGELLKLRGATGLRDEVMTPAGGAFETVTATISRAGSHDAGFVQIAMNRGDEERLLAVYRHRMALTIALALLGTAVAAYLTVRAGMRPIERIGAAAAQIGSNTLHERIPVAGLPAELSGVAEAFNTMLDRLQQAFARVSRFSDDVAHELRTPINNLRGELEVALARARSPEEYRAVLSSGLEECDRLGRIVGSLLFLARVDDAARLHREAVDVGRELRAVCDFYEAAAADQGVALRLVVSPDLTADLDRTLFQQAAANLVSNAIAHTPAGGEIRLEATRTMTALRLEVCDTGCGVAPEHLPHVFERFYRADRARSGSEHVGLGLAVVRSIVERHGGQARMESTPGQGARVELVFPDPG